MAKTADEIRSAVSAAYGARARDVAAGAANGCCGDNCCSDASRTRGVKEQFYASDNTVDVPSTAVSYGCGNPVAIGALQPAEVVLDLGSGAGLDCFLAARQVGPFGRVFGLDMTDDMLALAEANKAKLGAEAANVSFHKGIMEAMPLPDAAVDVIISNCVINLSPDKDAVFSEAFRVLRPGGRLHVSDVVLLQALAQSEQEDMNLWAGCVSGALVQDDYANRLRGAGFTDIAITLAEATEDEARPWRNALIDAYKPGDGSNARPRSSKATIDLLAAPGLTAGACCGPECCS